MPSHLQYDIADGVAHIRFARPERLNAIDDRMGHAYRDACLSAVADESVRAVLITAEGAAFSAGGDVLAMAGGSASGAEITDSAAVIHAGIEALVSSDVPVVTAAQGAVAGGGIGLLLAADYVVVGEDLRLAGRYADLGLTPDLGVTTLLTRAIGERRALAVLLSDRELDAPTALSWGLAAEVATDPRARATDVAHGWASGPAHALGQAKRLVRASGERGLAASLEDEAQTIGRAIDRDEARQRIAAFTAARTRREGSR